MGFLRWSYRRLKVRDGHCDAEVARVPPGADDGGRELHEWTSRCECGPQMCCHNDVLHVHLRARQGRVLQTIVRVTVRLEVHATTMGFEVVWSIQSAQRITGSEGTQR